MAPKRAKPAFEENEESAIFIESEPFGAPAAPAAVANDDNEAVRTL